MKKLIIIDGNSLLFRAYFATSFTGNIMRRKDGFPTNAIFGFSNMISKIMASLKEDDLFFVSFDTGKKTFRHQEMDTYKAQRKPIDEDLKVQIPYARNLLKAMGVFHYELEGYEGDDLAGTVAKLASKENIPVYIYTSDKDYLQLIDDNITINMVKKGLTDIQEMNEVTLKETMGLSPDQIRDYKGLMGDPSDNIKGIPGVGEKTALKLILEYGNLENIIEAMKNEKSKLAQKIIENQELGKFSKHIATIDTHVEIPFNLDDLVYRGYDFDELSSFYSEFEFYSLLKKLKPSPLFKEKKVVNEIEVRKEEIFSFSQLPDDISTFYFETTSSNYHKGQIIKCHFANNDTVYSCDYSNIKNSPEFKAYFEDENKKKYTFDAKQMKVLLAKDDITLRGVIFDLLLASYLIDSSLDKDPIVIASYYGHNIVSSNQLSLFDDNMQIIKFIHIIPLVYDQVIDKLKEISCLDLFYNLELPLSDVLGDMEIEGFPLNKETLNHINENFKETLNEISEKIYAIAEDRSINLASPKQIADLLFNKLQLPGNKKNSTSIDVLNSLRDKHEIIDLIIEHRKYAKLISTYSSGLSSYVFDDGKIHALFNQALTTTGRLSSSEPNLQNISIRDEEGKLIRKAFFYDEENVSLLSLDYSQIELRLLAAMTNSKKLINIFNEGHDVHSEMARSIFNIPDECEVPSLLRRKAKAVNFGIVYGISDFGLSEQISCSVYEAKQIISTFYNIYPEIKTYFDDVVNFALENGYTKTLFNRRRYIAELSSDNYQTREFGKRASMNAPIQGTAADLIKMAMIQIDKKLKEGHYKSKLVLQIHDELIFKVYDDEKDEIFNLVKETMENVYPLDVKLEVDGSIAKTWYDAK